MVIVLFMLCIALLLMSLEFTTSEVVPIDTVVVLVGDSTALRCNSSINYTWRDMSNDGAFIYINGNISADYKALGFRMETTQEFSKRILIIVNVAAAFAGKYQCEDIAGRIISSAQLIVLEGLPECSANMDEFVGPNNCSIPPDEIQLSCSITYQGDRAPELEWKLFGEGVRKCMYNYTTVTENTGSRITCNLTIKPDFHLNGSVFVCQAIGRTSEKEYNCTTKPITILHSFSGEESRRTTLSQGDMVSCIANSSQPCTYKWVWYERVDDDLSRSIESKDSVLIVKKIGLHRCEAQCKLRNKTCLVFPKYIEVIVSDKNMNHSAERQMMEKENGHWTPPIIGLLILGVLPYVALACYLFTRMRGKGIFDRDRNPTCEQGSQTEESSTHGPITTNF